MAVSTGSSRGVASEINVTPLIDVLLVLLIIFMVIAPEVQRGIEAEAPRPSSAVAEKQEPPLVLQLKLAGAGGVTYALNRQVVSRDDLPFTLHDALAGRVEKAVFIQGDPGLDFGEVAQAVGAARMASASSIGVLTRKDAAR